MDVSATGAAAAAAAAQGSAGAITGSVAAPQEVSAAPAATEQSSVPQSQPSSGHDNNHSAIAPAVAKLFSLPAPPAPVSLDVSYRVIEQTHQIITVFTDPKTGHEVAQFPPEILINLAQFFDQHHGATFDRNA
jgi:uncharacterized FlaG/YvyC family protein